MPKAKNLPIVRFHFTTSGVLLKNRKKLKQFILNLFQREKKRFSELHYIFCPDTYLLNINKKYLKHNYYTDTITFDLSEQANLSCGEIYISIDRVRENARNFGSWMERELHRVMFHGALHLCGYKDKTKEQSQLMRKMEEKY